MWIKEKKIRILLIEDNSADVRLIEEYLKKSTEIKFELNSYSRLSEGLNSIKFNKYDIILLDLTLPDSERESTLENTLNSTKEIPIVILTGLDDKDIALESLQKGAQDYIIKNELDENILTRAILYSIERYKTEYEKVKDVLQKMEFDEKDKQILNELQENYKISYKELSEKVNLAASTIHNRVQNMLKNGIIYKFDTLVDPFKVGYESIAILGLSVDPLKLKEIAKKLTNYDEIQLVATTTGDHDMILRVLAHNEKDLWRFINEKIKIIDGIKPSMDVSSFIDIYKMTQKINFKT